MLSGLGSECLRPRVAAGICAGWQVPQPLSQPEVGGGMEWDWLLSSGFGVGVSYYSAGGTSGGLTTAGVSFDFGEAAIGARSDRQWKWVVRPEAGFWHWPESPEEDGLLLGFGIGGAALLDTGPSRSHWLGVELKWEGLWRVVGEEMASVQKVAIAYSMGF